MVIANLHSAVSRAIFPLILRGLCAQTVWSGATFYQDSSAFGMTCTNYVQNIFEGNIYMRTRFLVCSRLTACVRAHSLEGTLIERYPYILIQSRDCLLRLIAVTLWCIVLSLRSHVVQKHSDKQHTCSECDKSFAFFHQLKVHMAHHARRTIYPCQKCDQEFSRQSDLKQHLITEHSDPSEKAPQSCPECNYRCYSRLVSTVPMIQVEILQRLGS